MTTILLVEDNEMNRDMLSRRLIRRGYEVILAENGVSGVRMAQESEPALILMDLRPAGHRRARGHPPPQGGSAHARDPRHRAHRPRHAGRSAAGAGGGADDYDIKPVELERLVGKILALLDGKEP